MISDRSIEDDVEAAKARGESGAVNLPHYLFLMSFNVIGNLVVSRDLLDSQCKEGHEFFEAMDKVATWVGTPNIADFLPFLKWLDPQGLKRSMLRDLGKAKEIVASFVEERIKDRKIGKEKTKDFLDTLLEFEGDGKEWHEKIPYEKVILIVLVSIISFYNHILLDQILIYYCLCWMLQEIFFTGTETTSTTTEWIIAELLKNPEAMRKVKEELNEVVGENRKVEESDIEKLPYLQAVIKETLRLHPAAPLLLPRNTIQNTNFMGYHIPKDTQVFVNVWAIGRDPDTWEDPFTFKPERFLGSSIDYKGQNFELIPFGSGRRICVGISLAQRLVSFGLASLIHNFDWELDKNSKPESLDMSERIGITVRKLEPLNLIPTKRPRTMVV